MQNYCMYNATGSFMCSADKEASAEMNLYNNCYKAKASDANNSCDCRKSNCVYGFCRCNEMPELPATHTHHAAARICKACKSCGSGRYCGKCSGNTDCQLTVYDESGRTCQPPSPEYPVSVLAQSGDVKEGMDQIYPSFPSSQREFGQMTWDVPEQDNFPLYRNMWGQYVYDNRGPNPAYSLHPAGRNASNKMYGMNHICDLNDNNGRCGMWNDPSLQPNYIDKMKDPRNRVVRYVQDPLPDETFGYYPSLCDSVRKKKTSPNIIKEGFCSNCDHQTENGDCMKCGGCSLGKHPEYVTGIDLGNQYGHYPGINPGHTTLIPSEYVNPSCDQSETRCKNNYILKSQHTDPLEPYTSKKNVNYENRESMAPIPDSRRFPGNMDRFYDTPAWLRRFGSSVEVGNEMTRIYDQRRLNEMGGIHDMRNLGSGCLITPMRETMKDTAIQSWNPRFGPENLARENKITGHYDMSGVYDQDRVADMYGNKQMYTGNDLIHLRQLEGFHPRNIRENDSNLVSPAFYGVKAWNQRYGPQNHLREECQTGHCDMSGVYDPERLVDFYGRVDMTKAEDITNINQLEGMRDINRTYDIKGYGKCHGYHGDSAWCHRFGPDVNSCKDRLSADEYYRTYGIQNLGNPRIDCKTGLSRDPPSEC